MNKLSYNIQYQRITNNYYWFVGGMANNLVAYSCAEEVEIEIEPIFPNMDELMQQDGDEGELYFYHGDHLGSSSWITDGSGNVNQYLAYMPFGEDFIRQRSDREIRFKFTGKERDKETGFDYFGARYYASDLSIWLSVDPLSDMYLSTSPYMYVRGNPIMLIDPDGMSDTDYGVKKNGEVTQIGPTNSNPDRLYAVNDDGTKKSKKHVTVKDKTVLPELATAKSTVGVADAEGNVHDSETLRTASSNKSMMKLFKFVSDNSNVEWSLYRSKTSAGNLYSLGTWQSTDHATGIDDHGLEFNNVVSMVHSHPGIGTDMGLERESMGSKTRLDRRRVQYSGDWGNVRRQHREQGKQYYYYAYFPKSGRLYHMSKNGSAYIRNIGNNYRRFFFGTMK